MRTVGIIACIGAFISPLALLSALDAQTVDVLWFDRQRVINDSGPGQTARRELRALYEDRQGELDHRQRELRVTRDALVATPLGDPRKSEVVRRFQELLRELQTLHARFQEELAQEEAQRIAALLVCADRIAEGIRRERFAFAISPGGPLPVGAEDITALVAARMTAAGCTAPRVRGSRDASQQERVRPLRAVRIHVTVQTCESS